MSIASTEALKELRKQAKKTAKNGKPKFPPLPKDGEPMPKKLPKGAEIVSPDNPWIKL